MMTLVFLLALSGCGGKSEYNDEETSEYDGYYEETVPDDFSFSLEWDIYQRGSYDSQTEKLVKYFDTVDPPVLHEVDHVLTDEQLLHIYGLISSIHVFSYPDVYDPGSEETISNMSLTLTVRLEDGIKTIQAENIPMSFASDDDMGHLFLTACKEIYDIVNGSEGSE